MEYWNCILLGGLVVVCAYLILNHGSTLAWRSSIKRSWYIGYQDAGSDLITLSTWISNDDKLQEDVRFLGEKIKSGEPLDYYEVVKQINPTPEDDT